MPKGFVRGGRVTIISSDIPVTVAWQTATCFKRLSTIRRSLNVGATRRWGTGKRSQWGRTRWNRWIKNPGQISGHRDGVDESGSLEAQRGVTRVRQVLDGHYNLDRPATQVAWTLSARSRPTISRVGPPPGAMRW